MNTTILALDLGTHTGWALQHLDGTITSGTEHFKPQRFEGGVDSGNKLSHIPNQK